MPYIGNTIRAADDYRLIDDISSSFNGSTTSFALQVAGSAPVPFPKSPQQVLISVNGVIQEPDPTGASGFNLVGTNIVFSSAPTNGHAFFGIIYATADYLNSGGNFPSGSTGAPSLTFIGDEDTGIYRKGSGSVGFVSNSTEIANTDSNGITISSGNLILGDSSGASDDRIKLGASGDLQIYHNSNNSFIENSTGNLHIKGKAGEESIVAIPDGAVELYFDNAKKAETVTGGFTVTGVCTATSFAGDGSSLSGINTDLVSDTSPQLGGNLDVNTKNIVFGDSSGVNDDRLKFGASGDLQIYHDSNDSYIHDAGTGHLNILATNFRVRNADSDEIYLVANDDGAVELYHDNSKKIETTSAGVLVSGSLTADGGNAITLGDSKKIVLGTGSDLEIFHDGSNSYLSNSTGYLYVQSDNISLAGKSAGENYLVANLNGSVQLYHDSSKKFETKSTGLRITGNIHAGPSGTSFATDNDTYVLQAAAPSQAYISAYAANTGTNLFNHGIHVGIDTSTANIIIRENKSLYFYTNDSHRLTLSNSGHLLPAGNGALNLGGTSNRWANVYTSDLNLSNEGSSNDVDSTWGDYTIQEGFENLFLINNRTGKKFKFNLTEVS